MTSALPILFSGLIAFVDGGTDGKASAYVLASDMHQTYVIFEATTGPEGSYPPGVSCKSYGDWRECRIEEKHEVDLELSDFRPFVRHTGAKPGRVRPITQGGASDSAWLLRMANVDPSYRRAKSFDQISRYVRLRVDFSWKTAETCHLDQEEVEGKPGSFNIFPIRVFEYLSDSSGHTQAVAEVAMFTVEFSDDNPYIVFKKRCEADGAKFWLKCPAGKCSGLYISNDSLIDDDEYDIARHFDHYYKIAEKPAEKMRYLIRERESVPLSVKGGLNTCQDYYQILRARKALTTTGLGTGAETRVICPMVMFDKP